MRKPNGYPKYAAEMALAGEDPLSPEDFKNSIFYDLAQAKFVPESQRRREREERLAAEDARKAAWALYLATPVHVKTFDREFVVTRDQLSDLVDCWCGKLGDKDEDILEGLLERLLKMGLVAPPNV